MAEPLNTGLYAQQVLTAFDRALNDYTDAEIDALLTAKQDSISDLSEIRSGAAAGATAVQPAEFEADKARQDALEAEDRAALIAQVNGGAKNIMPINTVSFTSTGAGGEFPIKIPEGGYVLSCSCSATSSTSHLYLFDSAHSEILHQPFTNNTNKKINLSIDTEVAFARFDSDIANNTISNIMLCTAADWAVSQKFVPYRPSWQEMADNNKIIEISSQVTAESGYTVESPTHLYLQNNIVFGNIFIAKGSGSYSSSLTAVAKLPEKYAPYRQFVNICGFAAEQWSITNIGYGFIQAQNATSTLQIGQIKVQCKTANMNHLMLQVNYPIRLDDTL